MKDRNYFAYILIGLLFIVSLGASAQNKTTAYISEEGNLSFKINKPAFHVLLSSKGKIIRYAINGEGDMSLDMNGRLNKVGNVDISYDLDGRINKIGNERISYDLDNRVSQIGETKISYSIFYNGISNIKG